MLFSVIKKSCRVILSIIFFLFLSIFIQSPVTSWALDDASIGIRQLSSLNAGIVRLGLFLGLFIVSLLLIYFYARRLGIDLKKQVYLKLDKNHIKYISKYYATMILVTLILIIYFYLKEGNAGELPDFSANPFIFSCRILTAVVSAPLLEELLFRCILQEQLSRYSQWGALIFSAWLFAYIHGPSSVLLLIYQVFSGMIYGLLYMKTKNIKASIFLHMLHNLIAIIAAMLF